MADKNIKDIIRATTPSNNQKEKMLREILRKYGEGENLKTVPKKISRRSKTMRAIAACTVIILTAGGILSYVRYNFRHANTINFNSPIVVYASESKEIITKAGVQINTGIVHPDGYISGGTADLYLSCKNVKAIHIISKNQSFEFWDNFGDSEQKADEYTHRYSLSVSYEASDTDQFNIYWNPDITNKTLKRGDKISMLSDELRTDVVAFGLNLENGTIEYGAINLKIEDNGNITAKRVDMTEPEFTKMSETSEKKDRDWRKKIESDRNQALSKRGKECKEKESEFTSCLTKEEIEDAQKVAVDYYGSMRPKTEVVSMKPASDTAYESYAPEYVEKKGDVIIFETYTSEMLNCPRYIILNKNDGKWRVCDEGF